MDYLILFLLSLLAATLLPGGSEALLLALASQQENWGLLWGVATLGNTLGSIINYGLGRYLLHFQHKRWFPVNESQLAKGHNWFERFGKWSLLFAWLPIVGDALTLIAGILKLDFIWFSLLVLIGKGARYGMLLAGLAWWL